MLSFANEPSERDTPEPVSVKSGLDVLVAQDFQPLWDKKVAVITDRTAVSKAGKGIALLLAEHPKVKLQIVFYPADEDWVVAGKEQKSQLPAPSWPLGSENWCPPAEKLKDIDVLIYDVQDLGIRNYPRLALLPGAMQAAAKHQIPFYVLDRPVPIGGKKTWGPVLDRTFELCSEGLPIPIIYAMTPGELARMIEGEGWLNEEAKVDLEVVPLEGWKRDLWLDRTDLTWIPPSQLFPNLESVAFYPGMRLLDGVNLNVGQGTFQPYRQVGAPWISCVSWEQRMNAPRLPGIQFMAHWYTPKIMDGIEVPYPGESCGGLVFQYQSKESVQSIRWALYLLNDLLKTYPEQLEIYPELEAFYGQDGLEAYLRQGKNPDMLLLKWQKEIRAFQKLRRNYLLYR